MEHGYHNTDDIVTSYNQFTALFKIMRNRCKRFLCATIATRTPGRNRSFRRVVLTTPLTTMPPRSVSLDLKARIPILRYLHGFSIKDICEVLGIKKSLAYKTLQFHHTHGTTHNPYARRRGRRRQLDSTDVSFIRALLSQDHTVYLDEIQEQLHTRWNVRVSIPTLTRTLRRMHFTNKDVSSRAYERNEQLRAVFMNNITDVVSNPDMLMFGMKRQRMSARLRGGEAGLSAAVDASNGSVLCGAIAFQSFRSSHWTVLSHMTSLKDLLLAKGSFSFYVSLWYASCLLPQHDAELLTLVL
jgi:transposase